MQGSLALQRFQKFLPGTRPHLYHEIAVKGEIASGTFIYRQYHHAAPMRFILEPAHEGGYGSDSPDCHTIFCFRHIILADKAADIVGLLLLSEHIIGNHHLPALKGRLDISR